MTTEINDFTAQPTPPFFFFFFLFYSVETAHTWPATGAVGHARRILYFAIFLPAIRLQKKITPEKRASKKPRQKKSTFLKFFTRKRPVRLPFLVGVVTIRLSFQ